MTAPVGSIKYCIAGAHVLFQGIMKGRDGQPFEPSRRRYEHAKQASSARALPTTGLPEFKVRS
jgi:hypothetical protein